MDVVDRSAVRGKVGFAELLYVSDDFPDGRALGADGFLPSAGKQNNVPPFPIRGKLLRCRVEPCAGIRLEQDPMDWRKGDGGIVNTHKLRQRKTCGVRLRLLRREALLFLQPAFARCCEAVISVANGELYGGIAFGNLRREGVRRSAVNSLAAHMAAAHHQIKIVEQVVRSGFRPLHDAVVRIVEKHHDMRHFQRRGAAHLHTRWQPVFDRALRCADRGGRVGTVIIGFQIDHADQAAAHRTAREGALQKNEAVLDFGKDIIVQIAAHGLLNLSGGCRFVALAEVEFRQHQPQRGRRAADSLFHRCPVGGVRGKLVAGDDAPALHVCLFGQENVCRAKDLIHL